MARSLSETHSKMIGMLCPDVRNAYYANIFMECERAAFEKGYTLVLNNTFAQESLEVTFMEKLSGVYMTEADDAIHAVVAMIEPTLVAVLSVVIGGILLSVMLPLLSVLSAVG